MSDGHVLKMVSWGGIDVAYSPGLRAFFSRTKLILSPNTPAKNRSSEKNDTQTRVVKNDESIFFEKKRYYQPIAQRRFYPFFFATRRRNPPVRTLRKYCKGLDRYEAPTVVDPSPSPSKRLRGSPTRDGSTDRQLTMMTTSYTRTHGSRTTIP